MMHTLVFSLSTVIVAKDTPLGASTRFKFCSLHAALANNMHSSSGAQRVRCCWMQQARHNTADCQRKLTFWTARA